MMLFRNSLSRVAITCLLAALLAPVQAEPIDLLPPPLRIAEVAKGVFVSVAPYELASPTNADNISNAGFVIGEQAVAVIDTGGSRKVGEQLLAAIRARTDLPVRFVINTHDHPDHIFGNAAFDATGAQIVGHYHLPEALAARADVYLNATRRLIGSDLFAGTQAIPPTLLVHDRLTLELGGRRLLLEAWPVAHTDTDLTVFDEQTGTWFLGDLLFAGHIPALDGSLKGWLSVIGMLRTRPATLAIPGHGPAALPWPQAIDPTQRYLLALRADTRRLLQDGKTLQEASALAGQSERANWALFDDFNARNAVAAYHELEWETP